MTKKIIFICLIVVAGLLGGYFYTHRSSQTLLLSPQTLGKDQTEKISAKISQFNLDFSKSKEMPTLGKVPRYMVYNQKTGVVYYSKGTNLRLSPASFTKLLSTQVVLDLIDTNNQITATSSSLNKVPTILGIKAGESFSVAELLRGAIATSANDAAQVLADGAAKIAEINQDEFIYYMNQKAQLLGMAHSHFTNPDGLDDPNQYSTLEDMAKLVDNVIKNYPDILAAAKSNNDDIATTSAHGYYYLPNWNGLLGVYPDIAGLKIAYTEEAGYSTIVMANRQTMPIVAMVSGTDSYLERDRAAADLLDAAYLTKGLSPIRVNTTMLNRHYKEWGDLARKIKKELEATPSAK